VGRWPGGGPKLAGWRPESWPGGWRPSWPAGPVTGPVRGSVERRSGSRLSGAWFSRAARLLGLVPRWGPGRRATRQFWVRSPRNRTVLCAYFMKQWPTRRGRGVRGPLKGVCAGWARQSPGPKPAARRAGGVPAGLGFGHGFFLGPTGRHGGWAPPGSNGGYGLTLASKVRARLQRACQILASALRARTTPPHPPTPTHPPARHEPFSLLWRSLPPDRDANEDLTVPIGSGPIMAATFAIGIPSNIRPAKSSPSLKSIGVSSSAARYITADRDLCP